MEVVAAVLSKRSQKEADQTLHLLLCNPQLLLLWPFPPLCLIHHLICPICCFGYLGVNPWTQVGLACCEPTPFIVGCKVHCKPCPAYIWIHCTVALDSLVWCGNIQTDSWTEDLLDKLSFGNLATCPPWLVLGTWPVPLWDESLALTCGRGTASCEHLNAFCGFSQSGFTAFYRLPFAGFCFCSRTSSLTYSYHTHTNRGDLSKPSEMNGEQPWQQVQQCPNSKYRCALILITAVPQ